MPALSGGEKRLLHSLVGCDHYGFHVAIKNDTVGAWNGDNRFSGNAYVYTRPSSNGDVFLDRTDDFDGESR